MNPFRILQLVLVLPALLLATTTQLSAQPDGYFINVKEDGSKESLQEFMKASNVAGLSVVVYEEMEMQTSFSLGYGDKENRTPVNENTMFNVGGMAGSLYNFLALKAASQNKINLDDPVLNYMASWKFPDKGWMKNDPVTTRDLLLNKRKFSVGYKSEGQERGGELPSFEDILNGKAGGAELKVTGRKNKSGNHSYGGHLILRSMLEDVYGKPIGEIIEEEIFGPLEMNHSVFTPSLSPNQARNASKGYRQDGEAIPGGYLDYPIQCSGGFWTTPEDYGKFVKAIFRAASGEDNSLLNQTLATEATTEQHNSRALIFNSSVDLYWGGASQGFFTNFTGDPNYGTIIIVFTNSDINWQFTNRVVDMAWEYTHRPQEF